MNNRPIHVLLVGPAHTVHVRRWIKGLSEQGIRITLLTEKPSVDPFPETSTYLLPGKRLPKVLRYILGSIYVPYLVWKCSVDVVHFQSIGMNALLGLIAPSRRLILSPWGSDIAVLQKGTLRFRLVSWVVRRASHILTTSGAMKEKIIDLFGVENQTISVVSWGVDTDVFHPVQEQEKQRARAEWALPADKLVIVSNRTIAPLYRTHELVRAFARVDTSLQSGHLVLVRGFTPGNAKAREEQEAYIQHLRQLISPIKDHVTLLEQPIQISEMASLVGASDAVVAIPKTDQRSSSALEALASGKKVILSNIPPNRELALEGFDVTLVDEPVERELANVLRDLEPLTPLSMAANVELIQRLESWQNQLQRVIQLYAGLAKRN